MNQRPPFFSLKKILFTSSVILLIYILFWAAVLISNKIDTNHEQQTMEAYHKQFNSLRPEEKAIIRAEDYLAAALGSFKLEQRLAIDFLQRKFNLDDSLGAEKTPFQVPENPATYPQEIHFLVRMAYPNKLVTVPPRNMVDGATLTNIYSANCDQTSLPTNFWPTMNQNYAAGGYYLTHNALAFAFMKDNNCFIPASESELLAKTIEGMVHIASNPNSVPDLRYEAIAFLGLSGRSDLIEKSWIDKIISEQRENGGWLNTEELNNSDHTAVLATWALLEYAHPNIPHEPLIHRPTERP